MGKGPPKQKQKQQEQPEQIIPEAPAPQAQRVGKSTADATSQSLIRRRGLPSTKKAKRTQLGGGFNLGGRS